MPIVEPEDKLIEIDLKVLCGHAMIDTDDRSLEQAPKVLHAHRVDISVDESFAMTDNFVLPTTGGLGVALEFVGYEQFSTDANEGIKERGERFGFEVLDLPLGTASAVYLTFTVYQGRCAHCETIHTFRPPGIDSKAQRTDRLKRHLSDCRGYHLILYR